VFQFDDCSAEGKREGDKNAIFWPIIEMDIPNTADARGKELLIYSYCIKTEKTV